ncbi:hypothetical protein BK132_14625 [Paenibacillus sp. FSL H8-0259]|nr:hypothetical protein BK132_14625 [Paenibacillus sp. FSL H8-0259]
MLEDTPRKLLRIMYQFKGHFRRMPTMTELARLSGRRTGAIKAGMLQLVERHYIEWDEKQPVETAVVIEAWERDVKYKEQTETGANKSQHTPVVWNTEYWTHY